MVSSQHAQPFTPEPYVKFTHPEWSKNAVIYQVNTRQYSQQGSFAAVTADLPRIKALGADIVWLMPIHPIGEKHRKGTLGSPYSVRDYIGVNPEFGTLADLQALVKRAHQLGMYVLLDWVANHTAWDHPWVTSHPEWYAKDHNGTFRPSPWWDWHDIIELDYDVPALRKEMINAMCYWVEQADIDGFRCDVAGYVPNDFWRQARAALMKRKHVFMLAEWEARDLHEYAFDMTYAWSWNEAMHAIAHGRAHIHAIYKYYSWNERAYPRQAYRMTFVSNHDKNAWDGTQYEQFGDMLEAAIVLSVIGEGMPLIHNGQEAGESKRLAFFEKDLIDWQPHSIGELYQHLIALKKRTPALWNGEYGARMIHIPNSQPDEVLSFVRQQDGQKVLTVLNFSSQRLSVSFDDALAYGQYAEELRSTQISVAQGTSLTLAPWDYHVFVGDAG
ncbi:alpha-amylase family glycosyl hydrolase [Aestuariibacter salexigens]|uniref:alpha-amylase family glycosyl hydrolase n=1 Tax=Aestuariibacter salexigens TaxID=226010 RepID=UPI000406478B|nr:alpha-amylase family glycosyl hydrolase [Aestuariibacter salexigens]